MTRLVLPFTVRLLTPISLIEDNIRTACVSELNKRLNTGVLRNLLRSKTRDILQDAIESQPEYMSLADPSGELKGALGVVDSATALNAIVRTVVRSIEVRISPMRVVGTSIYGTITISAVPSDLSDVLSLSSGKYNTEKGETIPWLEWLLTRGDEIIIATHDVVFDPKLSAYSRTGGPVMKVSSSGWRVPPAFSGTIDNNFITRAVAAALPEVGDMLIDTVRSKI